VNKKKSIKTNTCANAVGINTGKMIRKTKLKKRKMSNVNDTRV